MKRISFGRSAFFVPKIVCLSVCLCTLGITSCEDDYDDTEIRNDIQDLDNRVTSLEDWQKSVNTDIQSLQALVRSLESKNFITAVTPVMEGMEEVGYTISFQTGESITIKNGKNGKDGKDGEDGTDGTNGITPIISVAKDPSKPSDTNYYWTIKIGTANAEFLTDEKGNKISATGPKGDKGDTGSTGNTGAAGSSAIAPKVRINDTTKEWEISTDNGKTWTTTGVVAEGSKGDQGDAIFAKNGIDTSDPDNVTFTLADGTTKITVPRTGTTLTIEPTDTENTFTVTSSLLEEGGGNVVDIRVESENADGTTILSRSAVETRWNVESSIAGNVLTITANPAVTVKLDEKALLKVTVSNSNGKVLASGQKVFSNELTHPQQTAITDKAELMDALADESKTYVVLYEDMEIPDDIQEAIAITSDKEIDLNNQTLECSKDGMTIFNIKEGNVIFSNGTIKLHNTYAQGNCADIVVGVDMSQVKDNPSDEVISRATATFSNVNIEGSIYVSYGSEVEITDSEINTELYGICTNANKSNESTESVKITLTNTTLKGETPVFVNVPATLTIDNCIIVGGWQGVMMRGGNATITNTTISLEESLATPVEGTSWDKDRKTGKTTAWGSGNEVAIAGITMGNNVTNAYQYPTVVTLKNTHVTGYEGYWAVYADATEKCTVNFTYDSQCTFGPSLDPEKSFEQGKGAGSNYITVTDGTGTTTKY